MKNYSQVVQVSAASCEVLRDILEVENSMDLCGNDRAALLDGFRYNGVITAQAGGLLAFDVRNAVPASDKNDVLYSGLGGFFYDFICFSALGKALVENNRLQRAHLGEGIGFLFKRFCPAGRQRAACL